MILQSRIKVSDFLSAEDKELWKKVKNCVRPLHLHSLIPEKGRAYKSSLKINLNIENARPTCYYESHTRTDRIFTPLIKESVRTKNLHQYHHHHKRHIFDTSLYRKIARGYLLIPICIDLHGMSQKEAYSQLLFHLQSAQQKNIEYVIVITGKGNISQNTGILRKVVPFWFETTLFNKYIHSFKEAAERHGGSGAFYIRLRRISKRKIVKRY